MDWLNQAGAVVATVALALLVIGMLAGAASAALDDYADDTNLYRNDDCATSHRKE